MTNNFLENLPDSIHYIIEQLRHGDIFKPSDISRIIREANVDVESLTPWADFDHPVGDSYGRKLVYDGGNFEVMVMSWCPGDFAAIHDHGYTEWGAVQIFGPAEHAVFRVEEQQLVTLKRWIVERGDIIGVSHQLIHQMGNPTSDAFFLSLHVYGVFEQVESVTGDARLFDLCNEQIQRINGGVFFGLPPSEISSIEAGPSADFPTHLRYMIELIRRFRKMEGVAKYDVRQQLETAISRFYSKSQYDLLIGCLAENIDEDGHQNNSRFWEVLNWELKEAAALQNDLKQKYKQSEDAFHKYAALYDELICQPCLDTFMANYWEMFEGMYGEGLSNASLISIGCGTALVERYLIDKVGMKYENIYGIDISEAMVVEARRRIQADVGDVLALDPSIQLWDIAFSGLNVFQYLDANKLEEAIQKTAAIVKEGGYFIGDFITPDHIRWYPNVMYSEDQSIISLRNPKLIEQDGKVYQESEIINVNFKEQLEVSYSGKHKRFLPPLYRVRRFFEKVFGDDVTLYDAVTLDPIPREADSCPSTRYVIIARKGKKK